MTFITVSTIVYCTETSEAKGGTIYVQLKLGNSEDLLRRYLFGEIG